MKAWLGLFLLGLILFSCASPSVRNEENSTSSKSESFAPSSSLVMESSSSSSSSVSSEIASASSESSALAEPNEDDKLSVYFSTPEKKENIVYTVYLFKVDKNDHQNWVQIMLLGFAYTSKYADSEDFISVGFSFTDNSSSVYYIEKSHFEDLIEDKISPKDFITLLKIQE